MQPELTLTQLLDPLTPALVAKPSVKSEILKAHQSLIKAMGQNESKSEKNRLIQDQFQDGFLFQTKAGCEGVNTLEIAKMIRSLSKNSEFYKTEERRLKLVREKVKKYVAKIERAKLKDDWSSRDFEVKRRIV
jgi:hypothetical protein